MRTRLVGARPVDDTPHIRVRLADVELPNRVRFTQYVFRMRRCAMAVVLDDARERVLLMRRHRFIVERGLQQTEHQPGTLREKLTDGARGPRLASPRIGAGYRRP
jgi:hypothetical protein